MVFDKLTFCLLPDSNNLTDFSLPIYFTLYVLFHLYCITSVYLKFDQSTFYFAGRVDYEVLIDYISKNSPVTTGIEDNIQILQETG
jgi:hypothetical protein